MCSSDLNLRVEKIKHGHAQYKSWREKFGEFRSRGDEDRYIEENTVCGLFTRESLNVQFRSYTFHYVEVYYVPVPTKDGVKLERKTRTCYRYGIMTEFPYARGIAVVSGGGNYSSYNSSWTTTDADFNGTFSVYCNNEHSAAKFFKPAVVLAFNDVA